MVKAIISAKTLWLEYSIKAKVKKGITIQSMIPGPHHRMQRARAKASGEIPGLITAHHRTIWITAKAVSKMDFEKIILFANFC